MKEAARRAQAGSSGQVAHRHDFQPAALGKSPQGLTDDRMVNLAYRVDGLRARVADAKVPLEARSSLRGTRLLLIAVDKMHSASRE